MKNAFGVTVEALRKQGLNSDEILGELSKLFQKLADSNSESATEQTTIAKIRKTLQKMGMPVEISGYRYWVEAILFYKEGDGRFNMKKIYTKITEKYGITYSKAERCMRFAIECVEEDVVKEMFGNNVSSITGKPKIKQFLSIVSEQI